MHLVPLYGHRSVVRGHAKVDDADCELVSAHRWHLSNGYAANGEQRYMHRVLLGLTSGDGIYVDHCNGDTLDNRRSNLRAGTQSENECNRAGATRGNRSSRFRGVTLDKRRTLTNRWIAQAKVDGRYRFLGRYATEEEAARVAAEFRREHMPTSRT